MSPTSVRRMPWRASAAYLSGWASWRLWSPALSTRRSCVKLIMDYLISDSTSFMAVFSIDRVTDKATILIYKTHVWLRYLWRGLYFPSHCNFYICLPVQGGIKAVIWTDAFQAFIMLTGLVAVIVVVRSVNCVGQTLLQCDTNQRIELSTFVSWLS